MSPSRTLTVEDALGLGLDHLEAGRADAAIQVFAAVLAAQPGHLQATYLLGAALLQAGRAADALPPLSQAAGADPGNWRFRLTLAGALAGLGRALEAMAALRLVLVLAPAAAEPLSALADLAARADARQAARLVARVLAAGPLPPNPPLLFNFARLLIEGGAEGRAGRLLRQGAALQPDMPEIANALAVADLEALRLSAAARARRVVALAPGRADYRFNLAAAWALRGATDAAAQALRQALALSPDLAAAHNNLGLVLKDQSLAEMALAAHGRALALAPDATLHRNRLAALLYGDAIDEARRFAMHRAFGRFVSPEQPAPALALGPRQRLTLAYLSSDFRDHPVGRGLEPVIGAHDRSRFRIALYVQRHRPDGITRRFEAMAELVRDVSDLDDATAAALMRRDGIDILVTVAGRYDRNRPGIAAHRAAPVQVSLHDPATSGLEAMDYLIADPVLAPRDSGERFTERVVRLPYLVVQTPLPAVPATRHPGGLTFGSLNAPAKLSNRTLSLWARLLAEHPGSRLLLKSKNLFASRALRERIQATLGVDPSRLDLRAEIEPLDRHLANYRDIDIALDPFPFTGSTTTFEALWMGVPVVTLRGTRMAGRWSASMLSALRLDDLIAENEEAYLEIAARLAADRARLSVLRETLRGRLQSSPLMDGTMRAKQLERVYRAMWRVKKNPLPPGEGGERKRTG
jgi:protein O-GlcNAc transferase